MPLNQLSKEDDIKLKRFFDSISNLLEKNQNNLTQLKKDLTSSYAYFTPSPIEGIEQDYEFLSNEIKVKSITQKLDAIMFKITELQVETTVDKINEVVSAVVDAKNEVGLIQKERLTEELKALEEYNKEMAKKQKTKANDPSGVIVKQESHERIKKPAPFKPLEPAAPQQTKAKGPFTGLLKQQLIEHGKIKMPAPVKPFDASFKPLSPKPTVTPPEDKGSPTRKRRL